MTMGRSLAVAILTIVAASARAEDMPLVQPAAAWVKPIALDATSSKSAKDAPVAVLLADHQVRFGPDSTAQYFELASKAQTAQGLEAIGLVSLSWDPAFERLLVHKLRIIRGGKEIDYLARGSSFLTLRRETRLEAATLDGTLTATTQLEGLEVGDILDLAYTVERADPLMKGHAQADIGLNMGPLHHAHLRLSWPISMRLAWRGLSHAPEPAIRTKDGWTEAELDLIDPNDPIPPKGAPPRFLRGPELQFGNFSDWADVSALLSREFAESEVSAPDSPLMQEAKSIADRSSDPKARAEAALALVQDKIRYVLLALEGGGLRPAPVDVTWSRRFADCKGKTVTLLALLHALGIEAEPALVSTMAGDGLDERLPLLAAFDHVLVRATINGRIYWLDGTRAGDVSLDEIRTPGFKWALPIRAAGGALVKLDSQDYDEPVLDVSMRLDASAGLTLAASAHGEMVMRGDAAVLLNRQLANVPANHLETALKEFWRKRYDYIDVEAASVHYDPAGQTELLVMDGKATLDWQTGGGYEVSEVEYQRSDFQRLPGPDESAPVAVAFPHFERHVETVILPNKGIGFTFFGDAVDEIDWGVHFQRRLVIEKGIATAEVSTHAVAAEVSRADAEAASRRLTNLSKHAVRIVPPPDGVMTREERAIVINSTPRTTEEYVTRGNALLDERRFDEALADFDASIRIDPGNALAWADRAIVWAWKGDAAKVQSDSAEALRLDSRQIVAFRAQGLVALRQSRWSDGIRAFSSALALKPGDLLSRSSRAWAYLHLYDPADALKDCDAGLEVQPDNPNLQQYKAEALLDLDRREEAAALARAWVADAGGDPDKLVSAARVLKQAGQKVEAFQAIDRAVALKQNVDILLARANLRSFDDLPGGMDDAKRALAIDAQSREVLILLARLNHRMGNLSEALTWAQKAMDRKVDVGALTLIGGLHHALGEEAKAAADFTRARDLAGEDPSLLNNICWGEATVNYDLPEALATCDAALQIRPDDPATLDSRAFVLLRLGRNEEALRDYDAALNGRPTSAASLYGRSLAERRIGRDQAAARDHAEALRKESNVVAWFHLYGINE